MFVNIVFWRLEIRQQDISDVLEWVKATSAICSAVLAALLFKADDNEHVSALLRGAAILFAAALVSLLVAHSGLIEHKHEKSPQVSILTSLSLSIGWMAFLLGFAVLVFVH